jgi:mRNA interferase HigB
MRIIAKKPLKEYWDRHANCRKELEEWYGIACKAQWKSPHDIKKTYPRASILSDNRVVFDIVGGSFRLIVKFAYRSEIGYVRFIGTHKEYDKINAETI